MKSFITIFTSFLLCSCTPSEKAMERKERRTQETLLQNQRENSGNFENNIDIKQENVKSSTLKVKD